MDKQKKTVHALSLPYSDPRWPTTNPDQEQAILSLLLPLLRPIGDYRRDHVARSRGRGRNARKTDNKGHRSDTEPTPPRRPELFDCLTVGFNSTIRRLESLSRRRTPLLLSKSAIPPLPLLPSSEDADVTALALVLVCRSSLPDVMTHSIRLLTVTASPEATRTALVNISAEAEAKIAIALNQPRVGVLGVEEEAPGFDVLTKFIQEEISPVEVPWLQQASEPSHLPVSIQTTETSSRTKSKKRKRANLDTNKPK